MDDYTIKDKDISVGNTTTIRGASGLSFHTGNGAVCINEKTGSRSDSCSSRNNYLPVKLLPKVRKRGRPKGEGLTVQPNDMQSHH